MGNPHLEYFNMCFDLKITKRLKGEEKDGDIFHFGEMILS